jgi:hypothetical protein
MTTGKIRTKLLLYESLFSRHDPLILYYTPLSIFNYLCLTPILDLKQFHRHTVTVSLYYGNIKVSDDIVMDIDFKPGEESYALQFFLFYRDRDYFHPGIYTVKIYIDNVKAGEKTFKITGKPDPFKAIRWNDNKTLHRMLKNGLNPNLKNQTLHGQALLHDAVNFGSLQDVHLLLEYGADPNVIDEHGNTPLFYLGAPYIKDAFEKAQLLIEHGASVYVNNAEGKTPLIAIIERNFSIYIDKLYSCPRYNSRSRTA